MTEAIAAPLEAWADFYVIIGSSAAALTGLQFVVMTLIAQTAFSRSGGETLSAFGTPNVVHFCSVLLVSAILSVPWTTLHPAAVAILLTGIAGTIYSGVVMGRARRQTAYEPVFEDWMWHGILPVVAYGSLLVAGALLVANPPGAMLAIGGAAVLLVFVGIHNAWDTVAYVATRPAPEPAPDRSAPAAPAPAAGAPTAERVVPSPVAGMPPDSASR